MTRKQRKAIKEYKQMVIDVENFKKEFNALKGQRKHKRVQHKDYTTLQDYYTKTLNIWHEAKENRYIREA